MRRGWPAEKVTSLAGGERARLGRVGERLFGRAAEAAHGGDGLPCPPRQGGQQARGGGGGNRARPGRGVHQVRRSAAGSLAGVGAAGIAAGAEQGVGRGGRDVAAAAARRALRAGAAASPHRGGAKAGGGGGVGWGGGLVFACDGVRRARLTDVGDWSDGYNRDRTLGAADFGPGTDRHAYRLEVGGNRLRLLIDGTPVLVATDDWAADGGGAGLVGLRSQGVQSEVRRVAVTTASGHRCGCRWFATDSPDAPTSDPPRPGGASPPSRADPGAGGAPPGDGGAPHDVRPSSTVRCSGS
jgi:hypothetical protein